MSIFSTLYGISGSSNGQFVKDPQRIPWLVANEADIGPSYLDSTVFNRYPLTGTDAWDLIGYAGATAQITDTSYVTVKEIASGSGVITNFFLPGVAAGTGIITLELTVDSTVYTKTFTAANATDRFMSGLHQTHCASASYTTIAGMWPDAASISAAFRVADVSGAAAVKHYLEAPANTLGKSSCIHFESSLLVRMKSSSYSVTNERDWCGICYFEDE